MGENHQHTSKSNNLALTGLILAAIAPTISVVTGFVLQAGIIAIIVFVLTKLWMFGLPAYWHLRVDGEQISMSKPKQGGWSLSFGLGIAMSLVIFVAYFFLGDLMISSNDLTAILEPVGLTNPVTFFWAVMFWIFVNSVLEEYLFRWFILTKLEQVIGGFWLPIIVSALIFTLHHTIALSLFISPLGNFLCSLGLFIGGIVFSWLYLTSRSVWIPWLAHALCDVAVFTIAWQLVIGF